MEQRHQPDAKHPFEQFKATMRNLVTVSKSDLDEQLRRHKEEKRERKAGRKSKKSAHGK